MTRPFDIENALAIVARTRVTADPITVETARLAEVIADGFRADFDATLDMETVGQALVVAAASVTNMAAAEIGMPAAVIVNMIGFTGESLVRAARSRAAEARDVEGVLCEHVLTWHRVDAPDDDPGVEIPLYRHIELPSGIGELRSHSREVPGCGDCADVRTFGDTEPVPLCTKPECDRAPAGGASEVSGA